MADLNELSQFEKDLKALIESRGGFQPLSEAPVRSQRMPTGSVPKTFMMVSEHGQPYSMFSTNMAVREHGRPYAQTKMKSREHGQPYRKWTNEEKEERIQEKLDQVSGYLKKMTENFY